MTKTRFIFLILMSLTASACAQQEEAASNDPLGVSEAFGD